MEPVTMILFGATGDLAKRKIYPALYNLFAENKLPQSFALIGLGRRQWSNATFRTNIEQSIQDFSGQRSTDPLLLEKFVQAFRYCVLDIDSAEDYQRLLGMVEEREAELQLPPNRLFYLSVGPEYFESIAAHIDSSGLGSADGWKRLLIEKPFGHDLQSARELNRKLSQTFAEDEVFRIDHYLGKPTVQMLRTLQQTNPVIQALWNNRCIANVQITANETVGVEERAGYYDQAGATRDMFQNHLLQLLMMTAIRVPHNSDSGMVHFKKKLIMEALEPLQRDDASESVVRGQYKAGEIGGKPVVDYLSEPGIAEGSMNDTFIAAKLYIDDSFWRGVPFYIRTGKRLKEKSTRIVIEFKEPLEQAAAKAGDGTAPNLLIIEMSPREGIFMQLNAGDNRNKGEFRPVQIDMLPGQDDNQPEAYEVLLYDAMLGDHTLFAHWDEVELSWAWVQPVLDAFQQNLVPLHPYEAGSYGPAASDELLARDGYHWWFDSNTDINKEKEAEEQQKYAYHTNY